MFRFNFDIFYLFERPVDILICEIIQMSATMSTGEAHPKIRTLVLKKARACGLFVYT